MEDFKRFAVYYAPEPGAFTDFTAAWLGWDAQTHTARAHPDVRGLPLPVAKITATPRKYGFHGTIKPPFRLAEGSDVTGLVRDLAELCSRLGPVEMPGLELRQLSGFLALVPKGDTAGLAVLAGKVVSGLDMHRAPPSQAELDRRRARPLSGQQEANLAQWGYPYVMEEFRFHLTLSGQLPDADCAAIIDALGPLLAPLLPRPFRVQELCLFGEDAKGRFHLLQRHALTGETAATNFSSAS